MPRWMQNVQGLLNLFLANPCPLCNRSTATEFCFDCTKQLQRCQLTHPNILDQQLPVFVWGNYHGALKRAIATLKYENQPQIARPLGVWLAEAWLNSPLVTDRAIQVVPIPLHVNKQKQRGYNQAALIAESFCKVTGLKLQLGLIRQKDTQAQFNLSRLQRQQNLDEAFILDKKFSRQRPTNPVLLLDDIYTTGATARFAAQTLQSAGIDVCGIVAIATSQGHNKA